MNNLDVLSRQLNIGQNMLIEASAGTGKTFSIENLVVRLLIEENITLEQMAVVTFTRAAASDLKRRVHEAIKKALLWLSGHQNPPDYLAAWLEKSADEQQQAQRQLKHALTGFDEAQIFTIHAFCKKALQERPFEADIALDAVQEKGSVGQDQLCTVRDLFRSEIDGCHFTVGELQLLVAQHEQSIERLESKLVRILKESGEIADAPSLAEQLSMLNAARGRINFTSADFIAEFERLVPAYNGLCNRKKEIKPEIIKQVQLFAQLLDLPQWGLQEYEQLLLDQLSLCSLFADKSLAARADKPLKPIVEALQRELVPILSPAKLLLRLAKRAQTLFLKRQSADETLTFDGLLQEMHRAMQNPAFAKQLKACTRIVIIDEFQDTDPLQWQIFRALLPDSRLYLVGDPKQSIYAFRQADIYTYLDAAKTLGEGARFTLGVNYRSDQPLVEALNRLFGACPGLFSLPSGDALPFMPVKAGLSAIYCGEVSFCTFPAAPNALPLHFALVQTEGKRFSLEEVEEKLLLPFITREIARLKESEKWRFNQSAILVADRFQAKRTADFLKSHGIPAVIQRGEDLSSGIALPALRELMEAILHPSDSSALRRALGGPILGWDESRLRTLNQVALEKELQCFTTWRRVWKQGGFAPLFEQIMTACETELLSRQEGEELYLDLQQLGALLLEEEQRRAASGGQLVAFLERLALRPMDDEELLRRRIDASRDAVVVTTLHSSKGLEYDLVFTLGLVKRTKPPDLLVPQKVGHRRVLQAVEDRKSPLYQQYCHEIDAEKMRQLYVAMTRAKRRLYCPAILTDASTIEPGCGSPMELLLAKLNQPIDSWLEKQSDAMSFQWLSEGLEVPALSSTPSPLLTPPIAVRIAGRPIQVASFTSLAQPVKHLDTTLSAPTDFMVAEKNFHTLPAGAETGILLHQILAAMPFDPCELTAVVHSYVQATPFASWEQTIVQMMQEALATPLDHFSLADVNSAHCYREMEFLYPEEEEGVGADRAASRYIKGVVDLFFYHAGRYYLLDWKSNWLGPDPSYYTHAQLEDAMEKHAYFLQADLYTEALKRYLKVVDPRPFAEIFGGVYYLFLRSSTAHCVKSIERV